MLKQSLSTLHVGNGLMDFFFIFIEQWMFNYFNIVNKKKINWV